MGTLEFAASVVKSTAWPAVVVFAVLFLQRPIRLLIASMSEFTIGKDGFTGKWERGADQARAGILQSSSPQVLSALTNNLGIRRPESNSSRIAAAWRDLEEAVQGRLSEAGDKDASLSGAPLIQEARARDLITDEQARSLLGLNAMRNLAVHGRGGDVSDARVEEFLSLADAMKTVLSITGRR